MLLANHKGRHFLIVTCYMLVLGIPHFLNFTEFYPKPRFKNLPLTPVDFGKGKIIARILE
jgi:hypothetical protein